MHMRSADCASLVTTNISEILGVYNVNVNFRTKKMEIAYDTREINDASLKERVSSLGYEISSKRRHSHRLQKNKELLLSLATGIFGLIACVLFYEGSAWGVLIFTIAAYFTGLFYTLPHSLSAILKQELDIDV